MPSPTEISVPSWAASSGCPMPLHSSTSAPRDTSPGPRFLPGALRRDHRQRSSWATSSRASTWWSTAARAQELSGCGRGCARRCCRRIARGRVRRVAAGGGLLVDSSSCRGATHTDARCGCHAGAAQGDSIACPWLIRRFVGPARGVPFVPPRGAGVAERFGATPSMSKAVFWTHRDGNCTSTP